MRVHSVRRDTVSEGRVRLSAHVQYDRGHPSHETIWFDVPLACADYLSDSGNPWLVALLPLAVTLGERLDICRPVDPILLSNIQELMLIWKCWYPDLTVVPLGLDTVDIPPSGDNTAAFYSGGVDSFFTVLQHHPGFGEPGMSSLQDLILVWGFDIPLTNADAFARKRERSQRDAQDLGLHLIDIATNLRQTRFQEANWSLLSHGCALGAVALILEKRYRHTLISSSHGYRDLDPWGSHPLTDPLASTASTRISHYGAAFTRVQKTALLTTSEVALRSLHVCYRLASDKNCGACEKCYRTMVTLHLLKALDRCTTFPAAQFQVNNVFRIFCQNESSRSFIRELKDFAAHCGDIVIAHQLDRCLRRSARLVRIQHVARRLSTTPLLWRVPVLLRRAIRRTSIV